MSDSTQPVLELRDVTCGIDGHSLRGVSLQFAPRTLHLVRGEPACLRGLLLRVLGLFDSPESGSVFLEKREVGTLAETERDELRNQRCGFLFAAPFLLPTFSVVENVAMPLFKISHFSPEQARARTDLLLEAVGLSAEAQQPVDGLSQLQQHAVSLARALANEPAVITVESLDAGLAADEAVQFASLLRECCARFGVTMIASVSRDFSPEPGDRVVEFDGVGAVRASVMEGKPLA